MAVQITWKSALVLVGAVGVGVYVLDQKAKQDVKAVANAVNPVNPKNVFYQGTDAVGSAVTGNSHFDLGHSIYCFFHSSEPLCNPSAANTGVSGLRGIFGV